MIERIVSLTIIFSLMGGIFFSSAGIDDYLKDSSPLSCEIEKELDEESKGENPFDATVQVTNHAHTLATLHFAERHDTRLKSQFNLWNDCNRAPPLHA